MWCVESTDPLPLALAVRCAAAVEKGAGERLQEALLRGGCFEADFEVQDSVIPALQDYRPRAQLGGFPEAKAWPF